jgi:two-component system NtrC family sensor kinase
VPLERLLVIDDSKEARDFLEEFLGHHGYVVLTACDGEEGLLRALNEDPDLILVDMRMSEMTGLEFIEAFKREDRDTPIIFLTAHGTEDLVVRAFRLGVVDYVPKPYEPKTILDVVERALEQVHQRKNDAQLAEELVKTNQTLQRQLQELSALNAIGKSISALDQLDQLATRAVEAATFMTRAEEGALILVDERTGELCTKAVKSVRHHAAQNLDARANDQLATHVVNTGRPILLSGEKLGEFAGTHPVNALLLVPLKIRDRGIIGVLKVANTVQDRTLGEHEMHLLSTIGDFVATGISNVRAMANLQTEKHKLATVLAEISPSVLVVDEQAQLLMCNQAAKQLLELDGTDAEGFPIQDVIRERELLELLHRALLDESPLRTELSLANGRTYDAHARAVAGVGYAIVLHDITFIKKLDLVKSGLISTFSHDLRTPLTTVQGYVDLLARVGELNDQQQDFIMRVQRSLSTINYLIDSFVDSNRIETGIDIDMVPTELKPIIQGVVEELRSEAEAKQQHLGLQLPTTLSLIIGDSYRLSQALGNLVRNAISYTPPEGHINVEVSEGDGHISISVKDDGIGISVADQPYIFDKFYRADLPEVREVSGAGLGLSIAKSVVEKHGGRVWVKSSPGEGSTFTCLLPISSSVLSNQN